MRRYYTRACNFYYGNESKLLVNKKNQFLLTEIRIFHLIKLKYYQEYQKEKFL